MSELPKGWNHTTLNSVGSWGSGGTPKRTNKDYYDGKIPWLVIGDLNDGLVNQSKNTITELGVQNSSAKLIDEGTLLIAMYGSIGKLGITGFKCATNQAIANCTVNEELVNKKYLFYYLKSRQEHLLSMGKGGAQQNISQTVLKAYDCPIAPLNEQIRIADKLDSILAKVDAAQARLDKIPNILKRFRQSVLAAATSGELTKEWREKNSILELWRDTTIGDLCVESFYGPRFSKNDYTEDGIPTIRTTDMTSSGVIEITEKTPKVNCPEGKVELFRAKKDDLLITRTGSIGTMAIFKGNYLAIPSAYLIRFRFNRDVIIEYLYYFLTSPIGKMHLGLGTTSVAQPNINAQTIKSIELKLPPYVEQQEIIRRVESLFTMADTVEKQYKDAKAKTDRLTQSILSKAFRGELVPQDENDEPAGELIKRITEMQMKLKKVTVKKLKPRR